jgi:hypothetical protein
VLIAVGAAVVNVRSHISHEFFQTVVFLNANLHMDRRSIFQQAVPAGLIFFPGMNVGIVPECNGFDALTAERFDAGKGTGGTAGMKQNGVHDGPSFL